jgi:transposase
MSYSKNKKTMAAAYSYDLRVKVIKFLENQGTIKAAAELFNINRKTVMAWKEIKKATGDVLAKTGYQVGHRLIIKDTARFKQLVEENKDKSSVELARLWHRPVSSKSVLRLLKKLGYSYKKNFYSSQKRRWSKG